MQKCFFIWIWKNAYKWCFANVYFCIINKMTLNLSSNFTLIAMYTSFSMQFKWNNWT